MRSLNAVVALDVEEAKEGEGMMEVKTEHEDRKFEAQETVMIFVANQEKNTDI